MPIVQSDIKWYFSGGSANTDKNLSRGGAISNTQVTDNTLENLFPTVTGPQATSGVTHYRLVYIKNTHATIPLTSPAIWIDQVTVSTSDEIAIGLDPAAIGSDSTINTTEDATGTSTPAGVTFSAPLIGSPLSLGGDLPANGGKKGIWVRRTVNAGASAYNDNNTMIKANGQTTA